jgi:hypothetical protein
LVVSAVVAGGAVLAGCSSPGGSASPSSSAPSTTAASSSTTLVTAIPTTTTTIPGCTGSNFALSTLGSEGAAGTIEVTFGFRNTSSATCPLFGYPGIQLLGPGGAAIATTTVRGGSLSFTNFAPTDVSVAPGATVFFNLGYSDVPTGGESSCPTATGLQAIAPNTTTGLRVSGQFDVCNNATVTVSPVFGKGSPETSTTAPPQS